MAQKDNSSGKPGVMLSPEQHRQAKKAAQARKRKSGGTRTMTTDIMSDVKQDREEQREAAKAAREQRQHTARVNQAMRAYDDAKFADLKDGTLAHKLALGMLVHFPLVTPNATSPKRCQLAFEESLRELTDDERKRTKAIGLGRSVAIGALNRAYQAK